MSSKFVLMQEPSVQHPRKPNVRFYTIGLTELYPGKGYGGCDEFGNTDSDTPGLRKDGTGQFAFYDEDSKDAFKGPIITELGIDFAIVSRPRETADSI